MFSLSELNLPLGYYIALAALCGLALGSFLNVVIHRIPLGQSITLPASHCPHCQTKLRPYDNIPLLSFALLRGRCHQCQTAIAWRYPAVELLTALLFAAIVWRTGAEWWALAQMAFGAAMLALVFIDAQHHLLPDVITYPAFVSVFLVQALRSGGHVAGLTQIEAFTPPQLAANNFATNEAALYGGLILALAAPSFLFLDWLDALLFDRYFEEEPDDVSESDQLAEQAEASSDEIAASAGRERQRQRVVVALLLFGFLLAAVWAGLVYRYATVNPLIYERAYHALQNACFGAVVAASILWVLRALYFVLRRAEGMGLGDVKMMAVIGGFLGWYPAFGVLLYGSILGAIAGLIVARYSKDGFNTAMPFGVCLGAVAILVMLGL
ncbi:MAG: prepilin peptidase [Acidobacteria bacterium]|nr:prepilin peptidase [Acidobacteriota bacterium]MBI3423484.1 prepilin peptidase [Acidobacteriota bacterium]